MAEVISRTADRNGDYIITESVVRKLSWIPLYHAADSLVEMLLLDDFDPNKISEVCRKEGLKLNFV